MGRFCSPLLGNPEPPQVDLISRSTVQYSSSCWKMCRDDRRSGGTCRIARFDSRLRNGNCLLLSLEQESDLFVCPSGEDITRIQEAKRLCMKAPVFVVRRHAQRINQISSEEECKYECQDSDFCMLYRYNRFGNWCFLLNLGGSFIRVSPDPRAFFRCGDKEIGRNGPFYDSTPPRREQPRGRTFRSRTLSDIECDKTEIDVRK